MIDEVLPALRTHGTSIDHPCLGVQPGKYALAKRVIALLGWNFPSETQHDEADQMTWCFLGSPRVAGATIQILEVPFFTTIRNAGNHLCLNLGRLDPVAINESIRLALDAMGVMGEFVALGPGKWMLYMDDVFQQGIELKYEIVDRP